MQKRNFEFGFSLVELLIAAGMLSGLGVLAMQLTKQNTKASVKFQHESDTTLIVNEINAVLSDPAKCLATFSSTTTPNNIDGKYFTSSVQPAAGYGNSGLKIYSYQLQGTAPNGVLDVVIHRKEILKTTNNFFNKKINIYFEGALGAITRCRSLSSASTDIWSRGAGANIYYNGGNIGIGTSNPTTPLHVVGTSNFVGNVNFSNGNIGIGVAAPVRKLEVMGDISATGSLHIIGNSNFVGNTNFSGGNIGVGVTTPVRKLEVAGDISATGSMFTSSLQYTSDKKLKKNIVTIFDAMEKITALRGVRFNWKANNTQDVGLVAQEVRAQIPELVKYDNGREVLTVDYVKVVPFLIEAVKEQQKEITQLKRDIQILNKR